jgi:hypothetical protein
MQQRWWEGGRGNDRPSPDSTLPTSALLDIMYIIGDIAKDPSTTISPAPCPGLIEIDSFSKVWSWRIAPLVTIEAALGGSRLGATVSDDLVRKLDGQTGFVSHEFSFASGEGICLLDSVPGTSRSRPI